MNTDTIEQIKKEIQVALAHMGDLATYIITIEEREKIVEKEKVVLRERKMQLDALEQKLKDKIAKVEKILGE